MHELMAISDGVVVDLTDPSLDRPVRPETGLDVELDGLQVAFDRPPRLQAVEPASEFALGSADLLAIDPSQVNAGTNGLPPELAWQERALCAQTDPEAFFPEKGGSTREAKRVCMACEVRAECLEYALAKDERFGIWGGLSERERRRVKKQAV